jgi:hypothetical protein
MTTFSNAARIACEKAIFARCVESLLAQGYSISLNDGEETTVRKSREYADIIKASRTTDEDYLMVYGNGLVGSFIWFIYGNDGPDVISDYSLRLEDALKDTLEFADKLDSGKFTIKAA